jgi:hypothetical protein
MNLDNREIYLRERQKLFKLSTKQLEALLGELFARRYGEHDISVDAYYRIVAQAYNTRLRKGDSLIFHLKNFLR